MAQVTNNADFEDVLVLIQKFCNESLHEYGFVADRNFCQMMFERFKDSSLFLEVDGETVGVLGGMISGSLLDQKKTWQEIIWYVDFMHRGDGMKLYEAMEKDLKSQGVERMVMVSMKNSMHNRVDRIYKSLGYVPFEVQYIKNLES